MKLFGRHREIFDILCEKRRISVAELAKLLYVTEMTIRRDLTEMEKQGLLKRYRGGAIFLPEAGELPVSQRMYIEEEEKRELAKKATAFLGDDMYVFVDSSSTCQYLIPHLKKYNGIKMVTNSVKALLSATKLHIPCMLIGGEYCEQDMCCVGSLAERSAEKFHVDVAFFTTLGITEEGEISDSDVALTMVKERIMQGADKSVFLFEKSKLGKRGLYTLCHKNRENTEVILA